MNYNNLCYRCFFEKPIQEKECPKCGYKHTPNAIAPNCLLPGTLINKRYIIGAALGVGGFGITYKCLDTQIGGVCAIKEYFPANIAVRSNPSKTVAIAEHNAERFKKIMKRFVEEAELVRKLKHPNIIEIYDCFFENNTAYYVMEYCDGIDLRKYTGNFSRKLEYGEGLNILYQVMNGLEYIHSKNILHRDIAPDNIYITKNNTVKILDFGSARSEMDQFDRALSVIVKVGYAPIEQYGGNGKQGSYTDVYALGATFYHLFTSRIPIESTQRVAEDMLEPFSKLRPDLPDNLKYCIEKSMALRISDRISGIPEMKRILGIESSSVRKSVSAGAGDNRGSKSSGGANQQSGGMKSRDDLGWKLNKQTAASDSGRFAGGMKSGAGLHQQYHGSDSGSGVNRRSVEPHNANQYSGNSRISKQYPYRVADISRRMGAYAMDLFLWGVIYFILLISITSVEGVLLGLFMLFPIVFTLINTILELTTATTFGKAVLRLYVRGRSSVDVMPSQILMRNVVKVLGVFVVVFGRDGELLEDIATDSIVCLKE